MKRKSMMHQKSLEPKTSQANKTEDVATTTSLLPPLYTLHDYESFLTSFDAGTLTFRDFHDHYERLILNRDAVQGELQATFNARKLAHLASQFGSWCAEKSSNSENAVAIYQGMVFSFLLGRRFSYTDPTPREVAVDRAIRATTPEEFAEVSGKRTDEERRRTKALTKLLFE